MDGCHALPPLFIKSHFLSHIGAHTQPLAFHSQVERAAQQKLEHASAIAAARHHWEAYVEVWSNGIRLPFFTLQRHVVLKLKATMPSSVIPRQAAASERKGLSISEMYA